MMGRKAQLQAMAVLALSLVGEAASCAVRQQQQLHLRAAGCSSSNMTACSRAERPTPPRRGNLLRAGLAGRASAASACSAQLLAASPATSTAYLDGATPATACSQAKCRGSFAACAQPGAATKDMVRGCGSG